VAIGEGKGRSQRLQREGGMGTIVLQHVSQKCGVASPASGASQMEQVAGKSHLVACRTKPGRDCQLTVDIDVWEHKV